MFSSNATQVSSDANYIESCFSTYLYTGNGATQTINNGIDLAGKGGLVWVKNRTNGGANHALFDTNRSSPNMIRSDRTDAQVNATNEFGSFTSTGFTVPLNTIYGFTNFSTNNFASWTFRKQPKFFDVITWVSTGSSQIIPHSLGSVPGFVVYKSTTSTQAWLACARKSDGSYAGLLLNTTDAELGTQPNAAAAGLTSTTFSPSGFFGATTGQTYVAYLFAHNAGGFGTTGTDNVVSCGSFTTDGSGNATVNLGYEPQWILYKPSSAVADWGIVDSMRGMPVTSGSAARLYPNASYAEGVGNSCMPNATGFTTGLITSTTYIYIAIRRGPMKVPTDGTKVFSPQLYTGTGATSTVTGVGFTPDVLLNLQRNANGAFFWDKLRGGNLMIRPPLTAAETTGGAGTTIQYGMDGYTLGADTYGGLNVSGATYSFNSLQRAPGFFDEVCYTGTGAGSGSFALNHNLSATPELIILRQRNGASSWQAGTNFTSTNWRSMFLNFTNAGASQTSYASNDWFAAQPTAATFTVGWPYYTTGTYVAYLFATCPGVSKVGSYTGTGATQTIACGFAGGARFVLIKRTDSTGNWGVLDTARGMVAGTDPYLNLNTTAAEVNANNVYTATGGFQLVSSDANFNASGGSYIFLAIS